MKEKVSLGIVWILTMLLVWIGVKDIFNHGLTVEALIIIAFGAVLNPYVWSKLAKKFRLGEVDYFDVVRKCALFGGILVAYVIAIIIYKLKYGGQGDESEAVNNIESLIQIAVYIVYLVVLFMYRKGNKALKYIIFGVIYFICIAIGYASDSINRDILAILNMIPSSVELDIIDFHLLMNDFMNPIKEAILTYIIWDTIIEDSNKRENENKGDNKVMEEKKQEGEKELENYIKIEGEEITLKNIKSNIELEVLDMNISIRKK